MKQALDYNRQINPKFSEICKPLLDNLGLTHFIYINLLPNNKRLYLCNDISWIELYINYEFYNDIKHETVAISPTVKPECIFWANYGQTKVYDAARDHNMYNGFIIYEGNEIYSYATGNQNLNVISYIENYHILKHFNLYFKSKAQDIINSDEDDKLIYTKYNTSTPSSSNYSKDENIFDKMKINKFYLDYEDIHTAISPRELEYLVNIAYGKSAKEVSWIMGITESTAETHMKHIKSKLNCSSKSKVIEIFFKSNLRYLSPDDIKKIKNK